MHKQLHQRSNSCRIQEANPAHIQDKLGRFQRPQVLQKTADRFEAQFAGELRDQSTVPTGLLGDVQFYWLHRQEDYLARDFSSMNKLLQLRNTEFAPPGSPRGRFRLPRRAVASFRTVPTGLTVQ